MLWRQVTLLAFFSIGLAAPTARAAGVELEYAALERMIATGMLTDGGRLYLEGRSQEECRYAFVQQPRVAAVSGRLGITLLFSGRQAQAVAGKCVGPSGTFDIRVSGVPAYQDGNVYLEELRVETLGTGEKLFRLIAPLVESQLRSRLSFPLENLLGHLAYDLSTRYGIVMSFAEVDVPSVELRPSSMRLEFETDVVIR